MLKIVKICIEVPTWLGDSVMITPALEMLLEVYPHAKITLFGTAISTAIFQKHPSVEKIVIDESRHVKFRWFWLFQAAKKLGTFDYAFSFRSAWSTKVLLWFIDAKQKSIYHKQRGVERHQVLRYSDFLNHIFSLRGTPKALNIYLPAVSYMKPTLGLNPGASYGSAKRWYPEKFAEVAVALHKHYDIVIFGGPSEIDIANDIEAILQKHKIQNYQNTCGKTTIVELCQMIGGLSLFITGDSGPMHIAAAYQIPTVALFGPTKEKETSQWQNVKSVIIKKKMACAPCMKRTCPLGHHECMKHIESIDVLQAIQTLT